MQSFTSPPTNNPAASTTPNNDSGRNSSSTTGGAVAGVVVSLLLIIGAILGIIALLWIWRRYTDTPTQYIIILIDHRIYVVYDRKQNNKGMFPTSHFKVIQKRYSSRYKKDPDNISLEDVKCKSVHQCIVHVLCLLP